MLSYIRFFLYCVSSPYTDEYGFKKLGSTIHPVHRMCAYNTGDAPGIELEKKYDAIFEIKAKTTTELLRIERALHLHFDAVRQKRPNGNKTEWFAISLEEVTRFIASQSYLIRQLSIEEVKIIQAKSERVAPVDELKQIDEEKAFIDEQKAFKRTLTSPSLKEEFFTTFIAGGIPRRIQDELWDRWEKICSQDTKYRGIVQWATGTGKTIAMLMLFLISANACKEKGQIFRGLLISPKNDIFDTIIHTIQKISKWGITVVEGHNARLSSVNIPTDESVLITATHASLTDPEIWDKLPSITHCHYDEVHRSTGDEFYKLLQGKLDAWDTKFLTGTSATPKTCAESQHIKISKLYGNPLEILHKCDVDEAILEGWIAQPRFSVHIVSNDSSRADTTCAFVKIVRESVLSKMKCSWRGGKVIAYLPSRSGVHDAVAMAKELMPDWHIYTAVEGVDASMDDKFVKDVADGTPRILFACERYREGSDIKGLEMTSTLIGDTIAAHILLQIAGRALRNDYDGKEGWCVIVRPSEEGTTEDDVFDSIVLQIMEFIGKDTTGISSSDKIKQVVERFFGPVVISGKVYNVSETIHRIQAMYARKVFERSDPKEKYQVVRKLNKELGLCSKDEYESRASEHAKHINDPKSYFSDSWVSWYHFLGVDTSSFPQTKAEWIRVWKDMGISSWTEYKEKNSPLLPSDPGQMYEDYTNPIKEFEIEEDEHIY
jgi:superfamily II DNA or RNA helicase